MPRISKPKSSSSRSENLPVGSSAGARPDHQEFEIQTHSHYFPDPILDAPSSLLPNPIIEATNQSPYLYRFTPPTFGADFVPPNRVGSILPPTSGPLTTSAIPKGCYEKLVVHKDASRPPPSPRKGRKRGPATSETSPWEGPYSFLPIAAQTSSRIVVMGVPMLDCLGGFGIQGASERLFADLAFAGKTQIEFVITWPGYPDLNFKKYLSIFGGDDHLVTKREFARWIATEYELFVMTCDGWPCEDPEWRIGAGGYTFDRMRLSSIYWVAGDMWQARVLVLKDRGGGGSKPMRDLIRG